MCLKPAFVYSRNSFQALNQNSKNGIITQKMGNKGETTQIHTPKYPVTLDKCPKSQTILKPGVCFQNT